MYQKPAPLSHQCPLVSRFHCITNQKCMATLFYCSGEQTIVRSPAISKVSYPFPLTSLFQSFNMLAVISNPRKQVSRNNEVVVEKTFYSAFWRMWSPQVKNCRKDQRMNKPGSRIFRKPEFHKVSCFSILENQAMKMPH